jgi:hypothetical protein
MDPVIVDQVGFGITHVFDRVTGAVRR